MFAECCSGVCLVLEDSCWYWAQHQAELLAQGVQSVGRLLFMVWWYRSVHCSGLQAGGGGQDLCRAYVAKESGMGPGLSLAGHLKSTLAGQQPSAAAGDCRRISGGVGSREACSCVKLSGWSSQDKLTRRGNVSNALAPALPCANDVVAAVLTAAAGSLAGS